MKAGKVCEMLVGRRICFTIGQERGHFLLVLMIKPKALGKSSTTELHPHVADLGCSSPPAFDCQVLALET